MFKKMNTPLAKSLSLFCLFIILSYFGFTAVFGYGGSRGFFSVAVPLAVTAVNVPLDVSAVQQGSVEKVFNNGTGVSIDIPKGAVSGQTTFDVRLGVLSHSKSKMINSGINLLGDHIYTVSARDMEGGDVKSFSRDLIFEFFIPDMPAESDKLAVYYFNDKQKWIKVTNYMLDSVNKKISFAVNHLTDFAIFQNSEDVLSVDSRAVVDVVADTDKSGSVADNLYGKDKDVVEEVSLREAREINANDKRVTMSQDAGQVYELIMKNDGLIEKNDQYSVAYFIQNGTKTTLILGEGERGGVLASYLSAFGKVPGQESEWQDVLKIANGRWPSVRSEKTEKEIGLRNFKKVYNREANLSSNFDETAVMIMSYGLRPRLRSLDNERVATGYFKSIYGHDPVSAPDWDVVRAIAYSGARR